MAMATALAAASASGCLFSRCPEGASSGKPSTGVAKPGGKGDGKGEGKGEGTGTAPGSKPGGKGGARKPPAAAYSGPSAVGWVALGLWVAAAVALIVIGLVYAFRVRPRRRARDAVRRWDGSARSARMEISFLGGPEKAARRLDRYTRLPEHKAPNRLGAVLLMGFCGRPAVGPLTDHLHGDAALERGHAAVALGLAGDRGAFEALYPAVADPEPEVRMGAARALGRLGDERALMPLLARLGDRDAAVRAAAAEGLAELGASGAAPPLEAAAAADPDTGVRAAAAAALARLRAAR